MHIALYNLIDHKVEFIETHKPEDAEWNIQRLKGECIARNPQYAEDGKSFDNGPWYVYASKDKPFDWDIVDHQPTPEEKASAIRAQRNGLLAASDWTQVPDCPLASSVKGKWFTYRQSLRDITKQDTFPESVDWPEAPSA